MSRCLDPPDVGDCRIAGEEVHEFADAAVVLEDLLVGPVLTQGAGQAALVAQGHAQAGHEERGLPCAVLQVLVGEAGIGGENVVIRQ